jgi:glycine/D-amino acid oxidase-like deaminating enzyme
MKHQSLQQDQFSRRALLAGAAGAAGALGVGSRGLQAAAEAQQSALMFSRDIPVHKPYDVVVCGGGPSGTAAALAARRAGLGVLLIEGMGQLGGMGVSGLVSHWLGGRTTDGSQWVVGGLFRSMAQEAAQKGFALIPEPEPGQKYQPHGWYMGLVHGIPFDPFAMAAYLDEKVQAAGVEVLLLTQAADVVVEDGRITHVVILNKSGLAAVPARAVVDATGDADIAARSGCDVVKGREDDGLMTPATLQFHVDNVDQDALAEYIHKHNSPRFREKIRQLRAAGEWPFPYEIFISVQLAEKGTMMINTSRLVGIDGTDGKSKTDGMIRGRRETQELLAVMRKHFPGFENARLKTVAPLLGVRETRRIRGDFVLTVDDLVRGVDFEDTIGYSSYGWDLPDPKRPSQNPSHGKKRPVTPIPYRAMVPRPIQNLICPGRAISVQREVLGPLRVMAPCFAMGEAAGQAAAQIVRDSTAFKDVDLTGLRADLRKEGAVVDWPVG